MIVLPLLVVLVLAGVVYAARHHHVHATPTGTTQVSSPPTAAISTIGRWSLISLGAGLAFWAVTRTTLPIYYAALIGAIAFVLAVVAVVRSHDRSPALLIPLILVPLATVTSAAFVLLQ
jgi:peptidoglycan/LPS O-acetylase OafA/YrhL